MRWTTPSFWIIEIWNRWKLNFSCCACKSLSAPFWWCWAVTSEFIRKKWRKGNMKIYKTPSEIYIFVYCQSHLIWFKSMNFILHYLSLRWIFLKSVIGEAIIHLQNVLRMLDLCSFSFASRYWQLCSHKFLYISKIAILRG